MQRREFITLYKSVPTTPSSWAQDDRSALLLWHRSATLAGMKE